MLTTRRQLCGVQQTAAKKEQRGCWEQMKDNGDTNCKFAIFCINLNNIKMCVGEKCGEGTHNRAPHQDKYRISMRS